VVHREKVARIVGLEKTMLTANGSFRARRNTIGMTILHENGTFRARRNTMATRTSRKV
jgi:hypothetical protein